MQGILRDKLLIIEYEQYLYYFQIPTAIMKTLWRISDLQPGRRGGGGGEIARYQLKASAEPFVDHNLSGSQVALQEGRMKFLSRSPNLATWWAAQRANMPLLLVPPCTSLPLGYSIIFSSIWAVRGNSGSWRCLKKWKIRYDAVPALTTTAST